MPATVAAAEAKDEGGEGGKGKVGEGVARPLIVIRRWLWRHCATKPLCVTSGHWTKCRGWAASGRLAAARGDKRTHLTHRHTHLTAPTGSPPRRLICIKLHCHFFIAFLKWVCQKRGQEGGDCLSSTSSSPCMWQTIVDWPVRYYRALLWACLAWDDH